MDDLKEMTRSLDACNETILNMGVKIAALESEVQTYRNAARLYGIDPATMLTLLRAKSKPAPIISASLKKCRRYLSCSGMCRRG